MEQERNLFGLNIDVNSRNHLWDTARWARFLAVMGFIGCALFVVTGFFTGDLYARYVAGMDVGRRATEEARGLGVGVTIFYTMIAVICFFPCLFLFNFATKMKAGLVANDQEAVTSSFISLKKTFRFMGVITIIGLVFWILGILFIVTAQMTPV